MDKLSGARVAGFTAPEGVEIHSRSDRLDRRDMHRLSADRFGHKATISSARLAFFKYHQSTSDTVRRRLNDYRTLCALRQLRLLKGICGHQPISKVSLVFRDRLHHGCHHLGCLRVPNHYGILFKHAGLSGHVPVATERAGVLGRVTVQVRPLIARSH